MSNRRLQLALALSLILMSVAGSGSGSAATSLGGKFRTMEYESETALRVDRSDTNLDALTRNPWYWTQHTLSTGPVQIARPKDYELVLTKSGTLTIKADCNRASGEYKIDGQNISIKIGPSTLAVCPGSSSGEKFLELLGEAQKSVVAGDLLFIVLKDESILAFRAPSLVDRCGETILQPRSLKDSLDRSTSAGLDKTLAGFVSSSTLPAPGASMLVITPKGDYFKAVGVSNASTCSRLNADSPYQIGSNTKLMTAAIIYQLQEAGKISTTDLLSKYLPQDAARLMYGNEITLDMLLTHTSGLFDYFDVDTGDGGIGAGVSNKAILQRTYTPRELIDLVAASGKSNFKPGEAGKWKYCNTGFILLGMIIEKVTKKSYEENLKTRIIKPLRLNDTYLQTGQPGTTALPQSYYQPPFSYTTREWNASQAWSAGAVVSTSSDFAVFLKALFTGKLFKSRSTLGLMEAYLPSEIDVLGTGTRYGHGMLYNSGVLGHGGQTLGFQSDGGYMPATDTTIVIWSNSAMNGVTRSAVPGLVKILTSGR